MILHTRTSQSTHFTIDNKGGISCPKCKTGMSMPCRWLPRNTVHIERVQEAGHNVYVQIARLATI